MHSVRRSPEPVLLCEIRATRRKWVELDSHDRGRIRGALIQDFGTICAYCQRPCQSQTGSGDSPDEETIDHFRPRHLFPDLWLDWPNLIYACNRCNQAKGERWPGYNDQIANDMLTGEDSRYVPVSEYVNPNADDGRRPARDFFSFNVETGEVDPAEALDSVDWSMARRTVLDIDLNDSNAGENTQGHLWNRRLRQRDLLLQRLNELQDFDAKVRMMFEFMLPDKPFSSFISAYVMGRFPVLAQLFPQHWRP